MGIVSETCNGCGTEYIVGYGTTITEEEAELKARTMIQRCVLNDLGLSFRFIDDRVDFSLPERAKGRDIKYSQYLN